jgi:hypothetical protein
MSKSIYMAFAAALLAACTYNPPPDVTLDGPANGLFVTGEPIILRFSEPVLKGSLEIRVWPGQKDLYDVEGALLPGVDPILDICTAMTSPCGESAGVKLSFVGDRTEARLTAEPDALGPMGQPLVLEVMGTLADDSGHKKGVSRFFDFQIVETLWDPFADVVEEDISTEEVTVVEPLNVWEGPVLMHADFTSPIKLSQQFFCDLNVNQMTGDFVVLLTDADPFDWAPKNTNKPEELYQDTGDDSFIFIIHGVVSRDTDGDMVFESEPVTLIQNIGPISFELRDMVTAGKIDETGDVARWDGTLAVKEVYYEVNGQGTTYPSDQANFEIFQLLPEQIPEKMPYVCDPDPCSVVKGRCDLLPDWPPPAVCPEEER